MNPCVRDCLEQAQKARLDDLPRTAALFEQAARLIREQDAEIRRLRALLRRAQPRSA